MGGHKTKPAPPVCTPFTDTRFDYLDKLPCGVPPFQTLPSSSSSGPQPQFPSENGPAEITYYFPMPFTVGNPTGVFFPKDFPNPAPSEIDVILYLHGFKLGEFVTIDQYWAGGVHGIKFREDIVDGLEQAPQAFIGLLQGKNFGKLVIRVADE